MLEPEFPPNPPNDATNPSPNTLARLKSFALQRLGDIVQARSVDDQHWASSRSELIAAKELLNRFQ